MAYTIDHEDIWIESTEPLSWKQTLDDALNYSNLNINAFSYCDYQPTRLQFHLVSATSMQHISIKIPYANRLSRTHLKYAKVCRYDQTSKQWLILENVTNNQEKKQLEFTTDRIGSYGIFLNHYWYSTFTERIAEEYPNWTKIKQSKESTGQKFLNFFGMKLEEVEDYLRWIHDQKYIGTADLHVLDWIKKYQLPDIKQSDELLFLDQSQEKIPVLQTLKEFFFNDRNEGGIIDHAQQEFFTTFSKYGKITLKRTRDGKISEFQLQPIDHHIWNTFDEFGLLLGVRRSHLESNGDFKERILDVFRYPSNTTAEGFINGVARELSLIQRTNKTGDPLIWKDDYKDLHLVNSSKKNIHLHTLRIDDQPLTSDQYTINDIGDITIFAQQTGNPRQVSFIYGIESYQLYEKEHEPLHMLMFSEDGQATPKLLNWVEYINTVAPVMWGKVKWDEGFWDTTSKDLSGLGYLPNIWDSNIDIWKTYVFESER